MKTPNKESATVMQEQGFGRSGSRLAEIANELARSNPGTLWGKRIEGFRRQNDGLAPNRRFC